MEISIIVMCHNRLGTLEQCIENINANSKYKHEIIIAGDRISEFTIDYDYLPLFLFSPMDYYNLPATKDKYEEACKFIKENKYTIRKHFSEHDLPSNVKLVDSKRSYFTPAYDSSGRPINEGNWLYSNLDALEHATKEWIMLIVDSESYFPPDWDVTMERCIHTYIPDGNAVLSPKVLRAAFTKNGDLLKHIGELHTEFVMQKRYAEWYGLMYFPVEVESDTKIFQAVKKEQFHNAIAQYSQNTADREPCGHRYYCVNKHMILRRNFALSFLPDAIRDKFDKAPKDLNYYIDNYLWNTYRMYFVSPRDFFFYVGAAKTVLI